MTDSKSEACQSQKEELQIDKLEKYLIASTTPAEWEGGAEEGAGDTAIRLLKMYRARLFPRAKLDEPEGG
jgi:hypothetical protein